MLNKQACARCPRVTLALVVVMILAYGTLIKFYDQKYLNIFSTEQNILLDNENITDTKHHKWTRQLLSTCFALHSHENDILINKIGLSNSNLTASMSMYNHFIFIYNYTTIFRHNTEIILEKDRLKSEDWWIKSFADNNINSYTTSNFQHTFGPFIPLFIEWTRLIVFLQYSLLNELKTSYCNILYSLFDNILNYNKYIYVTVIQHDQGFHALLNKCDTILSSNKIYILHKLNDNILAISSGGYGHVPIPLCNHKQLQTHIETEHTLQTLLKHTHSRVAKYRNTFTDRHKYLIGFSNSVWDIRYGITIFLEKYMDIHNDSSIYAFYYIDDRTSNRWKIFSQECCKFILTVRGRGPASFSLCENIQMGNVVPVFVYDNPKWLPYKAFYAKYSINFQWNGGENVCNKTISDIIDKVKEIYYDNDGNEYNKILNWIKSNKEKYFAENGIIQQVKSFLTDAYGNESKSELHCYGQKPFLRNFKDSICTELGK